MKEIAETAIISIAVGTTLVFMIFFISSCDMEYRKNYLAQSSEQHCAQQPQHNQSEFCRNFKKDK